MALLHEAVDFKKLDVRLVERNIDRGVLTRADLNQAVSTLPDDLENATWVSLDILTHEPDESELNGHASMNQH